MKKIIFSGLMILAVCGTTMAQTPAKSDTTSKHTSKKGHMKHKSTTTKTTTTPQQ